MKLEFESHSASLPMVDPQHLDETQTDSRSPETEELLRKGIKAAQDGERAEARSALLRVTDEDPDNEHAWLWLASISEYPEELLVFLNNVLRINPENGRASEWASATKTLLGKNFVERGIEAYENEQGDHARQCFMQAIVHDDRSESAWMWLATISDSEEEKNSYLHKVLRINPENESAMATLSAARSKEAKARLMDANRMAISGDREGAEQMLESILSEMPDMEDAWMLRGHLAESFNEKIACFERVLDINPDNQVARANLDSLVAIVGNSPMEEVDEADEPEVSELEMPEMKTEAYSAVDREEMGIHEEVSLEPEASFEEEEEAEEEMHFEEFEAEEQSSDYSSVEVDSESFQEEESSFEPQFEEFSAEQENEFVPEPAGESYAEPEYTEEVEPAFAEEQEFEPAPVAQPEVSFELDSPEPVYEPEQPSVSEEVVAEEPSQNGDAAEFVPAMDESEAMHVEEPIESRDTMRGTLCPFCSKMNEPQAFMCAHCNSIFSLSDLEMLLANEKVSTDTVAEALKKIEMAHNVRGVEEEELRTLGIGYLNMREYRKGLEFLQEYSAKHPSDVLLSSQVDALAVRVAEKEADAKRQETMPSSKTILVVDDSPTIRKLISLKLQKCGHETVCAVDGVDALEKINERKPDLVLLDITMPRMDGYQVCKQIRGNEDTKDVPVVMISGKDGFFDKVRGKMVGTTNYITKPFGPETLMRTVNEYLA